MTADTRVQERVFALLGDPANHARIHRIDTHAASVFLEGNRALKIKHAIAASVPADATRPTPHQRSLRVKKNTI